MSDLNFDFNPFEFQCNTCLKKQVFNEQIIEKIKVKVPHSYDEYCIYCSFCKKGIMQPPTFVMTSGTF